MKNELKEHLMHFQTILYESDMEKLKTKTNQSTSKDALGASVEHYLKCKNTKETVMEEQK